MAIRKFQLVPIEYSARDVFFVVVLAIIMGGGGYLFAYVQCWHNSFSERVENYRSSNLFRVIEDFEVIDRIGSGDSGAAREVIVKRFLRDVDRMTSSANVQDFSDRECALIARVKEDYIKYDIGSIDYVDRNDVHAKLTKLKCPSQGSGKGR